MEARWRPEKIRRRRKQLLITQEILAKAIGISRAHVARIERGTTFPTANIIARIANVLKVRPDYFFKE